MSDAGVTMSDADEDPKQHKDSAHKIWLAGLGALGLAAAEEEGTKLFSDLVYCGRELEARGKAPDFLVFVDSLPDLVWEEGAGKGVRFRPDSILKHAIPKEQIKLLLVEAKAAVPAAETSQLRRNAQARRAFLAEFDTLTSREVGDLVGSRATNQAALANRWKTEGRIFAVEAGGQTLFPAFQFSDDDGRPLPIVAEILVNLQPRFSGWQTALWFTGCNGWLGGKRPVDILKTDPAAVLEAVRQEAEAFD
jgi:hypothetical protein